MDVLIEDYEEHGVNPRLITLRIGLKEGVIELETALEELDDLQNYIANWVEKEVIRIHG